MKRSEKQLQSKANFGHVFQLNCPNFKLKQCERPESYQNCQKKLSSKETGVSLNQKQVSEDFLLILYLLIAKFVRKRQIWVRIYFIV